MKQGADKPLITPAPPSCPLTGMTHTEPAGADVLNSRLQTWAEALVGRVVGPAGKQRAGGLEAKGGDTFKHAFFLVYELHGPAGDRQGGGRHKTRGLRPGPTSPHLQTPPRSPAAIMEF